MLFEHREWVIGRQTEPVDWLRRVHRTRADLCSTCVGALLLAETGLLDGLETTTHWAFAPTFQRNSANVNLQIDELLIVAGSNRELVRSGAASSWQDLTLYLTSRHANFTTAHEIGTFLLYRWDSKQTLFVPFAPPTDHGDGVIGQLQDRLHADEAVDLSVEEMARECGWTGSGFNRRFNRARRLPQAPMTRSNKSAGRLATKKRRPFGASSGGSPR